ncbi:MAG: hypothetical protein RIS47_537 [Bacteroidota bacterium]
MSYKLANSVIVLTQPAESAASLYASLTEMGANVRLLPMIETAALQLNPSDWAVLQACNDFEWLVFTSKNGVRFFYEKLLESGTAHPQAKIAAIGAKTASALAKFGQVANFVSRGNTSAEMWQAFEPQLTGNERILLVQGSLAPATLMENIASKASVQRLDVYETVPSHVSAQEVALALTDNLSCVVFTSPSAVYRLKELSGELWPLLQKRAVCIGNVTAKALTDAGISQFIVATKASDEGLLEAIEILLRV